MQPVLVGVWLAGLHYSNEVIGEDGVAAGLLDLGHVAAYALVLADGADFVDGQGGRGG